MNLEILLVIGALIVSIIATLITFFYSRKSSNNQIKSQVYTNFYQLLNQKENLLSQDNIYIKNLIEMQSNQLSESRAISIMIGRMLRDLNLETLSKTEINNYLNSKILVGKNHRYAHNGIVNFKIFKYHKVIMSYLYHVSPEIKNEIVDMYLDTMSAREKIYYLICEREINKSDIYDYNDLLKENVALEEVERKLNTRLKEYFYL